MHPHINIHTHYTSKDNDVFLFNNRFGFDQNYFLDKYFSIGVHPWDAELVNDLAGQNLKELASHENCLAIGECGLDTLCDADYSNQKHIFEQQLQLASSLKKPVIIHIVRAYDELEAMCKPYLHQIPIIIHGFNKSNEMADQLIHHGFYLSISSSFLNHHDATKLPLDKIFLETDSKQHLSIIEVYDLAAQKLSLDKESLKEKIYNNFVSVFKLKDL